MSSRKRKAVVAGAAVGLAGTVGASQVAEAHLHGAYWASAGTISNGSQSNIVGFWQALLCSKSGSSSFTMDGIFGSQTATASQQLTQDLVGYSTSNITASVWTDVQVAKFPAAPNPLPRLIYDGGNFWHYYTGTPPSANYSWAPGTANVWKFQHPSNGSWYNADYSHTVPSLSC